MLSLNRLFDTTGFMPRWSCGVWSPELGWTHIIADIAIFGAYMAIPLSIAVLVIRKKNFPFPHIFWLFVAFILSCGITHLIDAVIFYEPVYRLSAIAKVITAVVSWATVIALIAIIPKALQFRDIKEANKVMQKEIQHRQSIYEELEKVRSELEARSSELSVHRHRINNAMEASMVLACQWTVDTGEFIWEIGAPRWITELQIDTTERHIRSWNLVFPPAEFARFVAECREAAASESVLNFEAQVKTRSGKNFLIRVSAVADRKVKGAPRTATGMSRLIPAKETRDPYR